jgi:hypothetical protein
MIPLSEKTFGISYNWRRERTLQATFQNSRA